MAKQGTRPPKLDNDSAFAWWYNDGQRRTYGQVASQFGVAYNTVRNYASDNDWDGRGEELDRKAREILDARLASMRAQAQVRVAEIAMTTLVRFTQRFPDKTVNDKGETVDNPEYLRPGELTTADMLRAVKALESAGVLGQAQADESNELLESLAALREEVASMYAADELEIEDGEVVAVDGPEVAGELPPGDPAPETPSGE